MNQLTATHCKCYIARRDPSILYSCGVPGPGRCPRDRGEASYRDDFFSNMVQPSDLGRLPFVEVTADGITDFPVKLGDRVSFSENGNAERPCGEPTLRRVFYHKNQLAHGHFSKVKNRTLCRDGIPDATQCLVREVWLIQEANNESESQTATRREMVIAMAQLAFAVTCSFT